MRGSPPHMRGKVGGMISGALVMRITPAYAGKRTGGAPLHPYIQDHPRICGEKRMASLWFPAVRGSPPHMRGKDSMIALDFGALGDHPRICGEKTKKIP